MARLKDKYRAEVVPALKQRFNYKNVMEIPRLEKIVINMGLGDCKDNAKALEQAVGELEIIAGQKPLVTKAKKSIANFKLRAGMNVGAKVTLRGDRMYEFTDKLVSIVLPRVRDFRGVSAKAFDGRGNYALGVREQLIFPEIEYDKVEKIRGMEMIFVTTAKTDEEAKELLRHPRLYPLPHLRPSPLRAAQVRRVPHLLPRAGLCGPDPGRSQGQLVIWQF